MGKVKGNEFIVQLPGPRQWEIFNAIMNCVRIYNKETFTVADIIRLCSLDYYIARNHIQHLVNKKILCRVRRERSTHYRVTEYGKKVYKAINYLKGQYDQEVWG